MAGGFGLDRERGARRMAVARRGVAKTVVATLDGHVVVCVVESMRMALHDVWKICCVSFFVAYYSKLIILTTLSILHSCGHIIQNDPNFFVNSCFDQ